MEVGKGRSLCVATPGHSSSCRELSLSTYPCFHWWHLGCVASPHHGDQGSPRLTEWLCVPPCQLWCSVHHDPSLNPEDSWWSDCTAQSEARLKTKGIVNDSAVESYNSAWIDSDCWSRLCHIYLLSTKVFRSAPVLLSGLWNSKYCYKISRLIHFFSHSFLLSK